MPTELFDIIFSGKLIEGRNPVRVREGVRKLFKASDAQLDQLFSGKPISIKKGVDIEAAGRYRAAFRQLGALLDIRPSAAAAAPPPDPNSSPIPDITLAPANTGSLESYAPRLEPRALPDISGLDLAAAGADMDEPPRTPPARISTDGLDLIPGQDWTLEDCSPPALPLVMPDIDDLHLADPDDESHIPPEPLPLPQLDISGMDLEDIPGSKGNWEDN